jgi:hypothetical protein
MNYGTMKTRLRSLLNRDDVTDDQIDTYFTQGLQRIQRDLRLPHNERVAIVDTSTADVSQIAVPADWFETKVFLGPNGEIDFKDIGSWAAIATTDLDSTVYNSERGLIPFAYTRIGSYFYVKGSIPMGSTAQLIYYGPESGFTDDSTETTLSKIAPDLIVYAAMTYALDDADDDRAPKYEAKLATLGSEVQGQATDGEDRNGGSVTPPYEFDDGVP